MRQGRGSKNSGNHAFLCLGDLIAFYGRTLPNRAAILAPGRSPITYGALRVWAKHVMSCLRSVGVGRGDRVAVALPDGPQNAATTISVAAAAVCAPLNPSFTTDEWQRYLIELKAAVLLTRADCSVGRAAALALGIPVLDLSPSPRATSAPFTVTGPERPGIRGDSRAAGGDDAFILLTSGTTSKPKTVPLTHSSVCLSAYNVGTAIELAPQDRLLSVLPLFHGHGLISGVIAALSAGSSVVWTSGFDAEAFFAWLTEFRPTWYTAVPLIHRTVLSIAERERERARRSSLRLIRSASSTLPAKVLCGLETLFGVPVIDTFGMTEAATQITANPLDRRKLGSVGRSAGAEIAILDIHGRQLPSGERGEIAIRGPTITRGYDNDAATTQQAFRNGWFRTGDLGYLDDEGYLFLVGRIKEVINRGGQKIAPGEVEVALLSHPDVVEAAVFAIPHIRLGADIAAAVVTSPNAAVRVKDLREFVRKRLASFKVPGLIRIVPHIPKSPGGKINRRELAAALSITPLSAGVVRRRGKIALPRSQMERQLARIWADLLEVNQIGIEEDVFALGVDSLTVTQMILCLRERFGVNFSFKDIFEAPTVVALAARLKSSQSLNLPDLPRDIERVEVDGPQPVSIVQERMLRIERALPGLPQFNLPFAYRLRGRLNVPALERSLAEVVRRHESLRTGFAWRDELPVALITPTVDIKSPLIVKDLAVRAPAGKSRAKALLLKKLKLEAERESLKPINVKDAPLFRARLFRLSADDHVLLLVLHDIIIDGWSMGVFMEELSQLYSAFAARRRAQLPEPPLQFSDFARWQRRWSASAAATRQFAYWKGCLRKASILFASTNSDVRGDLAARISQERFHISNDLVARLSTLSHSRGATLFMTLLAGFKALLLLRSGRNDICVATMMANRSQTGTEGVIGPLANTTLIRTQIDADMTFQEALTRVRNAVLEAHSTQELPFDSIAARLAEEDGLDPALLIQVYFVLQVPFRRLIKLPELPIQPFAYLEGQSVAMPIDRTWLRMTLREAPSGIAGSCRYKNNLLTTNTVQHWIADYEAILVEAAADPKKSLGRLADR